MNLLIQALGLCAMIAWVSSIQLNQKSHILEMQILASIFYAFHYGMLNAMSAVVVTIISIVRLITIYLIERKEKEVPVYVLLMFILILVIAGIFTYEGAISILPIVITMIYTYSTWQKDTKVIRILFLVTGILWITYNFSIGSYLLMIGNTLEILSSIISFLRYHRNKKHISVD